MWFIKRHLSGQYIRKTQFMFCGITITLRLCVSLNASNLCTMVYIMMLSMERSSSRDRSWWYDDAHDDAHDDMLTLMLTCWRSCWHDAHDDMTLMMTLLYENIHVPGEQMKISVILAPNSNHTGSKERGSEMWLCTNCTKWEQLVGS